jgi:aminopeptidase N
MYYKGANMLHTIRQIVNNDEKWRTILRGLNITFYHQTVTTKQIEAYLSTASGVDLSTVFDQYLRDIRIPTLEYFSEHNVLAYRWINAVVGFNMPVKMTVDSKEFILNASTEWNTQVIKSENPTILIDPNFYVAGFDISK